ncbi:ribonuclease HI family protein [Thermodesulfovibrionales bacterium]|nr:ribonuclease HI family protein [Thermodesulfovibrionales bacterium]MCL0074569.1 ribonuclease HI family protein [Thermodesulfovibrionales bacterium]
MLEANHHNSFPKAILFCDGASSGNPGYSGIGILMIIGNREYRISAHIGIATNNIAEYTALIKGIQEAKKHGVAVVDIHTDSELVVRQIKGQYRVKSRNLIRLYEEVISLLKGFKSYSIIHIPREKNAEADALAKSAVVKKANL